MIYRALAALALGGALFILLPDPGRALDVPATASFAPDIIERYRLSLETDQSNLVIASLCLGVLVSKEIYLYQAMALGAADTPGFFRSPTSISI
jgi:hypothetical protein